MTKLYGSTAKPSTSATRVINQEILKANVVVHQLPRTVQDKVNDLLLHKRTRRASTQKRQNNTDRHVHGRHVTAFLLVTWLAYCRKPRDLLFAKVPRCCTSTS